MNLIKATVNDFDRLTQFYRDAILNTEKMNIYAKWIYGKHPTDEMILRYIEEGAMYFCEKDGFIVSAVAVTPCQSDDYHNIDWKIHLSDDEAAVVHILCVNPKLQKQGVAKRLCSLSLNLAETQTKKRCGWTRFPATPPLTVFTKVWVLRKEVSSVGLPKMPAGRIFSCMNLFCKTAIGSEIFRKILRKLRSR